MGFWCFRVLGSIKDDMGIVLRNDHVRNCQNLGGLFLYPRWGCNIRAVQTGAVFRQPTA